MGQFQQRRHDFPAGKAARADYYDGQIEVEKILLEKAKTPTDSSKPTDDFIPR